MLFLLTFTFHALWAVSSCDLFNEEAKIVKAKVQEMYDQVYLTNEFIQTAKENKAEADNQKLGRYLNKSKKQLDLLEHAMSQIKLHKECACPNFKFEYVDNLLVEVKFWIKKSQTYDLAKPKKTEYDAISGNLTKALARATDLQIYFDDPCKSTPKTSQKVVVKTESKFKASDSTVSQSEIDSAIAAAKAMAVNSNAQQNDVSGIEAPTPVPARVVVSHDSSTLHHKDSTHYHIEDAMLMHISHDGQDSLHESDFHPDTSHISYPETESVAEEVKNEPVMDTIRHVTVSVNEDMADVNQEEAEKEDDFAGKENVENSSSSEKSNESSTEGSTNVSVNSSGTGTNKTAVVGAGVTAATAGTAVVAKVATSDKNDDKELVEDVAVAETSEPSEENEQVEQSVEEEAKELASEGENLEETTDEKVAKEEATVEELEKDSSSEETEAVEEKDPIIEKIELASPGVALDQEENLNSVEEEAEVPVSGLQEEVELEETTEPIVAEEVVESASVEVAVEEAVAPKPVDNSFHYAVQIATGKADVKSGKYAKLNEDIYSVDESGLTKYRIGHYADLNSAVVTKKKAFNNGFLDAFVVAYLNGERISIPEAKKIEATGGVVPMEKIETKASKVEEKDPEAPLPKEKIKKNAEVFLAVQVGANITTSDPLYELIKYERQIGKEVKVLHGEVNRFYTGQCSTKQEVENLLLAVQKAGVKDAFLIGVSNGKRIDYHQAADFLEGK